MTQFHTEM